MHRVGIIDIGSNTIHLLIVDIIAKNNIRILDKDKEHLMLGENLNINKSISHDKLAAAVSLLKKYIRCCIINDVSTIIAVGTEALRKAENSDYVIDTIEKQSNLKIKILSPTEEAFFEFLGVMEECPIHNGVIMDTGGSSTELIHVSNKTFVDSISLPYGAINVSEAIKFNSLGNYIECSYNQNFFNDIFNQISWLKGTTGFPLIGIGGSFKNLAKIYNNRNYTYSVTNTLSISINEFKILHEYLKNSSYKERDNIYGLSKKRRDNILGGCEIISSLLTYSKFSNIHICSGGLRSGILINYINTEMNTKLCK